MRKMVNIETATLAALELLATDRAQTCRNCWTRRSPIS